MSFLCVSASTWLMCVGRNPSILLFSAFSNRLVGIVVRRPPRERKVPGSKPACAGIFSGSSPASDFKIGTPMATLSGAWRYRVSTGTGRPGVSILWLGEVERLICSFYLSVAARKIVLADPSLNTLACCWDVKQPTNKQTLPSLCVSASTWLMSVGRDHRSSILCLFYVCFIPHGLQARGRGHLNNSLRFVFGSTIQDNVGFKESFCLKGCL